MPKFVEAAVTKQQAEKDTEDAFFSNFPQLERQHLPLVKNLTSTFRAMNPKASDEDILAQAGNAAVAAMKLNGHAAPASTPTQPKAASQVVSEQVVGKQAVKGFQPAGVGEAAPTAAASTPTDGFEQILKHMQSLDGE